MIDTQYVVKMAAYNRWQNENLYGAADSLDDAARRADLGAFFGSIHATLNHLLWADQIWVSRFAGTPPPPGDGIADSVRLHDDWAALKKERVVFDHVISGWAEELSGEALSGDLTWFSGAMGREVTRPMWLLVTHLFNHQAHHRGQVHALLTRSGARPSDTDLPFME